MDVYKDENNIYGNDQNKSKKRNGGQWEWKLIWNDIRMIWEWI